MNIVFWLIVVAIAIQLWFSTAPFFQRIGKSVAEAFEEAKAAINKDNK